MREDAKRTAVSGHSLKRRIATATSSGFNGRRQELPLREQYIFLHTRYHPLVVMACPVVWSLGRIGVSAGGHHMMPEKYQGRPFQTGG